MAALARREHGRQRAVDGPELAVQRELAEELDALDEPGRVLLREHDAERDREVEPPARLRDVGRPKWTVMRLAGIFWFDVASAARTRSLLSRTAAAGKPVTVKPGRPPATWTSTVTR
jgi:hypothetical protein